MLKVSNRTGLARPQFTIGNAQMLCGGLDWSGTPDGNMRIPLYVPCIVAVQDDEKLSELFAELRQQFHMKQTEEFRGSKASSEKLAAVLNVGLQLDFRVAALMIDKTASPIIPTPKATFVTLAAKSLLSRFAPLTELNRLWCDDEDLGKAEERRFKNNVVRMARERGNASLKVSIYPSHKSDLIQLADISAYALSWDARKRSEAAVKTALQKIRKDPRNILMGPTGWGN